jgi:hypothetical protein
MQIIFDRRIKFTLDELGQTPAQAARYASYCAAILRVLASDVVTSLSRRCS